MRQQPDAGADWAAKWSAAIRTNLKALRGKVSTRALAERCANLGYPIARSTIASIENGDKKNVTIPELLVLARALDVPPVRLLFNVMDGATQLEVLPGVTRLPVQAMEWATGRYEFDGEPLTMDGPDGGIGIARGEHKAQVDAAFHLNQIPGAEQDVREAELLNDEQSIIEMRRRRLQRHQILLGRALSELVQNRSLMESVGMERPPLRDGVREAYREKYPDAP